MKNTENLKFNTYSNNISNNKLRKEVAYKAYQILQQLFFEDFELFKKFITNSNQNDENKSLFEKPEYPLFCKKYGETEIKYLTNQYLT